jgi:hypothetical protein
MQQMNQITDLDAKPRPCEDCVDCERPLKRKRVVFAEASSLRLCETIALDIENVKESCDQVKNEVGVENSLDDPSAHSDNSMQGLDLAEESVSDTQITTKTQDGPSPSTLATNALIHALRKNRSMSSSHVADFLREAAATICSPRAQPSSPVADADPCAASQACPHKSPSLTPLCLAVQERLRALSDRIEARGKASILPCTTNLRRSFLPALRFLMSATAAACASSEEKQRAMMEQG